MADMTSTLRIVIDAQNKSAAAFGQMNQSLDNLKRNVLGVVGALAGGLAFKDIIDATRTWGREVDQLRDQLGGTAEQMSALNYIGHAVGLTTDELALTFGVLGKKIADSIPEIEKGTSEFDKWNVKLLDTNGQIVGFDEAMRRIKARFIEIGQGAQGSALLMDLFGKSGKTLSDFLALTDPQMKSMIQDAKDFGLILGENAANEIEAFNRQLYRFNLQMTGLKLQIGQAVLPLLSAMIEKIRQASGFFKSLGEAIGRMLGPMKQWIDQHGGVKAVGDALLTIGVALLGLAVLGGMVALLGWLGSFILKAVPLAIAAAGLALIAVAIKDIADAFSSNADPLDKGIRILGDVGAAIIGLGAVMVLFSAPAAIVIAAIGLVVLAVASVIDVVKLVADNWDKFVFALKTGLLGDIQFFGGLFSAIKNLLGLIAQAQAALDRLLNTQVAHTSGGSGESGTAPGAGAGGGGGGGGGGAFAAGGIITRPIHNATLGEAGPEAVIPLSRGGMGGIGATINVYVSGNITENEKTLAEMISDTLLRQLSSQRNLSF